MRDEVKKLTVELYHWLGAGFKPQLSSLKPVVVSLVNVLPDKIAQRKMSPAFFVIASRTGSRIQQIGGQASAN